ncbi:MAG: hypothetical protein ABEJ84_07015 [Halodesulfurarchaeum sp.]
MTKTGENPKDTVQQVEAYSDAFSNAWKETVNDAKRMADGRDSEGWETLVVPSGDTAPEAPDRGREGRFGMVHAVPGNKSESLEELLEFASFPAFDVYRATVHGRVFFVTELIDPEHTAAVYVAGNYRLADAGDLINAAAKHDTMYTHLQKLDQTDLGSFEHGEWRKFFPNEEQFL